MKGTRATAIPKKKKRVVREELWNRFHLMHEHYGEKNMECITDIVTGMMKFCEDEGIIGKSEKINRFFVKVFTDEISCILRTFRKPKIPRYDKHGNKRMVKNKFFLRGFECKIIGNLGYYYYPMSENDIEELKESDELRVEAVKQGLITRNTQRDKYILQDLPRVLGESFKKITDRDNDVA